MLEKLLNFSTCIPFESTKRPLQCSIMQRTQKRKVSRDASCLGKANGSDPKIAHPLKQCSIPLTKYGLKFEES